MSNGFYDQVLAAPFPAAPIHDGEIGLFVQPPPALSLGIPLPVTSDFHLPIAESAAVELLDQYLSGLAIFHIDQPMRLKTLGCHVFDSEYVAVLNALLMELRQKPSSAEPSGYECTEILLISELWDFSDEDDHCETDQYLGS